GAEEVAEDAVDETELVGEDDVEDEADRDGRDDVREDDAHPPERLRPDVAVEHRGDEEREDDLRHGREQEDAERVAQRGPEVRLREDPDVLVESDELAAVADEIPVHERDD